jgi:hypothetical protein
MPSIFTIDGVESMSEKRKAREKALAGTAPVVGDCKTVKNPRTGCEIQLCYVGVGATTKSGKKSRTGWEFKKGSYRCPR